MPFLPLQAGEAFFDDRVDTQEIYRIQEIGSDLQHFEEHTVAFINQMKKDASTRQQEELSTAKARISSASLHVTAVSMQTIWMSVKEAFGRVPLMILRNFALASIDVYSQQLQQTLDYISQKLHVGSVVSEEDSWSRYAISQRPRDDLSIHALSDAFFAKFFTECHLLLSVCIRLQSCLFASGRLIGEFRYEFHQFGSSTNVPRHIYTNPRRFVETRPLWHYLEGRKIAKRFSRGTIPKPPLSVSSPFMSCRLHSHTSSSS